jgi:hypothetical protein
VVDLVGDASTEIIGTLARLPNACDHGQVLIL